MVVFVALLAGASEKTAHFVGGEERDDLKTLLEFKGDALDVMGFHYA